MKRDDEGETTVRSFGPEGYVVLAGMVVAFVVAPLIVYLQPPDLPFLVAYLILPLGPAILLAVIAVWATT